MQREGGEKEKRQERKDRRLAGRKTKGIIGFWNRCRTLHVVLERELGRMKLLK
jgi:hypothetical protein